MSFTLFRDHEDWDRWDSSILGYKGINERWESRSAQWYSPLDWLDYKEDAIMSNSLTKAHTYFIYLYYSLINLGLGELSPVNSIEFRCLTFTMIFSALYFTFFFSEIASILYRVNQVSILYQRNLDRANDTMSALDFNQQDRDDICQFFMLTKYSSDFQREFDSLLSSVPPSFQIKLLNNFHKVMLCGNQIVSSYLKETRMNSESQISQLENAYRWRFLAMKTNLSDLSYYKRQLLMVSDLEHEIFLQQLTSMLGTMFTAPESEIIKEGEKSNSMFFIVFGDCQVYQRNIFNQSTIKK